MWIWINVNKEKKCEEKWDWVIQFQMMWIVVTWDLMWIVMVWLVWSVELVERCLIELWLCANGRVDLDGVFAM